MRVVPPKEQRNATMNATRKIYCSVSGCKFEFPHAHCTRCPHVFVRELAEFVRELADDDNHVLVEYHRHCDIDPLCTRTDLHFHVKCKKPNCMRLDNHKHCSVCAGRAVPEGEYHVHCKQPGCDQTDKHKHCSKCPIVFRSDYHRHCEHLLCVRTDAHRHCAVCQIVYGPNVYHRHCIACHDTDQHKHCLKCKKRKDHNHVCQEIKAEIKAEVV